MRHCRVVLSANISTRWLGLFAAAARSNHEIERLFHHHPSERMMRMHMSTLIPRQLLPLLLYVRVTTSTIQYNIAGCNSLLTMHGMKRVVPRRKANINIHQHTYCADFLSLHWTISIEQSRQHATINFSTDRRRCGWYHVDESWRRI